MSWSLSGLMSTSASKFVETFGEAVDRNVTSDEERLLLKRDIAKDVHQFKAQALLH